MPFFNSISQYLPFLYKYNQYFDNLRIKCPKMLCFDQIGQITLNSLPTYVNVFIACVIANVVDKREKVGQRCGYVGRKAHQSESLGPMVDVGADHPQSFLDCFCNEYFGAGKLVLAIR